MYMHCYLLLFVTLTVAAVAAVMRLRLCEVGGQHKIADSKDEVERLRSRHEQLAKQITRDKISWRSLVLNNCRAVNIGSKIVAITGSRQHTLHRC